MTVTTEIAEPTVVSPATEPDLVLLEGPHSRLRELWLVLQTVIEFIAGFRALHFVGPCITVFGSLRQFVAEERGKDWDAYLRRGDFSRWIADVFVDWALAAQAREQEAAHRTTPRTETVSAVVAAIRQRNDLGRSSAAG